MMQESGQYFNRFNVEIEYGQNRKSYQISHRHIH